MNANTQDMPREQHSPKRSAVATRDTFAKAVLIHHL
jgi:hypothetical protein